MFLTQLASGFTRFWALVCCSRVSFSCCLVWQCPVVLSARLSAIFLTVSSKSVGISCFSWSSFSSSFLS